MNRYQILMYFNIITGSASLLMSNDNISKAIGAFCFFAAGLMYAANDLKDMR